MPPDNKNLEKLVSALSLLLHGSSQPTDTQRVLIESFIIQQGLLEILAP